QISPGDSQQEGTMYRAPTGGFLWRGGRPGGSLWRRLLVAGGVERSWLRMGRRIWLAVGRQRSGLLSGRRGGVLGPGRRGRRRRICELRKRWRRRRRVPAR